MLQNAVTKFPYPFARPAPHPLRRRRSELVDVVAEALPLDAARREAWRVWTGFYGRAAWSPALASELRQRCSEWRRSAIEMIEWGIEEGLFRADLDVERESDALLLLIDGLGSNAILDPRRWTAARQRGQLEHFLSRLRP
ncbi:MAG: TetR family transcriptional regulator C-terminal domain-containing protein [Myxococcota bacterium]